MRGKCSFRERSVVRASKREKKQKKKKIYIYIYNEQEKIVRGTERKGVMSRKKRVNFLYLSYISKYCNLYLNSKINYLEFFL